MGLQAAGWTEQIRTEAVLGTKKKLTTCLAKPAVSARSLVHSSGASCCVCFRAHVTANYHNIFGFPNLNTSLYELQSFKFKITFYVFCVACNVYVLAIYL